jgi:prepilin-type processing-associated H-X9-DG protein
MTLSNWATLLSPWIAILGLILWDSRFATIFRYTLRSGPLDLNLTARSGNTLAADGHVERVEAWANGDDTCPI